MSERPTARVARRAATLAAVAATVFAAAPLPWAGAVTTSRSYDGSTAANGVTIALHLPQAVGPLPADVLLGLISAHGELGHDGIRHQRPDAATAVGALGSGTLVDGDGPLAPLAHAAAADRARPDATADLGSLPANPLASGALGAVEAHVRGLSASSARAELVNGRVARLADLLPAQVRQQIEAALNQALPAAQQAVDAALAQLQPILGPIVSQDPTGLAAKLQKELQQLDQQLPDLLDNLQDSAVLTLDGLRATQTVRHTGAASTATAAVKLARLDVLGGLVRLTGFASTATATATGAAGGATAAATSTVASVQVGDGLLGVSLGTRGLTADVAGLLPAEVVTQVNGALRQVTDAIDTVLSQAGVSITPAATSHHADRTGRSADASGTGIVISLQPPGQPKPLVQVGVGAVQARTVAQVTEVMDERTQLPHTGGGIGTAGMVGASAALVGGLWLRRRARRA